MKKWIIKRPEVFEDAFHPSPLIGRQELIKEIDAYLKPFAQGRITKNLYVYGPSGTGKSTIVKSILK